MGSWPYCFYRECLALNWCDGTLRCNSKMYRLTIYFLKKTEKRWPFEFLGDRSTVKNLWNVVVLLTKTVHEFCCSLSRRSFVRSLSISLRIQPPISYKPTPFTAKVLKNYRGALTREQRGRGSLNFLPRFLEFNSIRLM